LSFAIFRKRGEIGMKLNPTLMEDLLDDLWMTTVNDLITKIKEGKAAPTDVGNAIKLLRDNGVRIEMKDGKKSLEALIETLQDSEESPLVNSKDGVISIEITEPDFDNRRQ
jgi:hypothetical protein